MYACMYVLVCVTCNIYKGTHAMNNISKGGCCLLFWPTLQIQFKPHAETFVMAPHAPQPFVLFNFEI